MDGLLSAIADYGMNVALLPLIIITVFFAHEYGHFIVARLCGMKIGYVSIGVGKTIWQRKDKSGVEWRVHLWPISAYVHIEDFNHQQSYAKRMATVLAGPAANFILPFILLFLFYAAFGKPVVPPVITAVQTDLPAYEAGLHPGDIILSIDNIAIDSAHDAREHTHKAKGILTFEIQRGDMIVTKDIATDWHDYKDVNGVTRSHGRVGILLTQQPIALEGIIAINGYEPADNEDAQQRILAALGDTAILRIESHDRQDHDYLVMLSAEPNKNLMNAKDEKDYKLYLGALADNIVLKQTIRQSWQSAYRDSITIIGNVMKLPFNLFPIDSEWLQADANLSSDNHFAFHYLYFFVFKTALFSVLIGFINLIPLPRLDGSVILLETAEALNRKTLSNRQKALLIGGAIAVIYASIFLSNAPSLHGYFDFKIEKLTEARAEKSESDTADMNPQTYTPSQIEE